jgi:ubiquitin C-terminal hydrolase
MVLIAVKRTANHHGKSAAIYSDASFMSFFFRNTTNANGFQTALFGAFANRYFVHYPFVPRPMQSTPEVQPASLFSFVEAVDALHSRQGARRGLENLGSTCYLNAVLQVLLSCTPLTLQLRARPSRAGTAPLTDAFTALLTSQCRVRCVQQALARKNDAFQQYSEQDAHEALRTVLDVMHEELCVKVPAMLEPGYTAVPAAAPSIKRETGVVANTEPPSPTASVCSTDRPAASNSAHLQQQQQQQQHCAAESSESCSQTTPQFYNQSLIADACVGVLQSCIVCLHCGRQSKGREPFYDLSLPLLGSKVRSSMKCAVPCACRSRRRFECVETVDSTYAATSGNSSSSSCQTRSAAAVRSSSTAAAAAAVAVAVPRSSSSSSGSGSASTVRRRVGTHSHCADAEPSDSSDDEHSHHYHQQHQQQQQQQYSSSSSGTNLLQGIGLWLGFKSVPLTACLQEYFRTERLRGADSYACDGCKCKTDADRSVTIAHAPEVLCLHIKRFKGGTLWTQKLYNR